MNTAETPQISSSCYASSTCVPNTIQWQEEPTNLRAFAAEAAHNFVSTFEPSTPRTSTPMATQPTRRIVQVFIADPNENVPLDKSVLFSGEQKLTDLNDTELFFEVPINELLKNHNAARVKFTDKEASKRAGKDIMLDPVKIRDLKMVVVTVASFS